MTTAIARLKVTLEDVEPEVMRRLDVPLKIRLDRLHLVLQAAMAGPTAISTSSRRVARAGAFPMPISAAGRCRQPRRRSTT